ncbi:hypothetical protein [Jeotgalibacillus terrae]|uniref:Helix-turn-helix type 11 domain-containing protein n=1 Tax=Jeotgalibacillus terrae TaxID=587735 RepID=A0ABW5ZLU6_9BACL|nr:hypothetical protein [Jeotgalibacillus terrae]MBM7581075.1 hypothetical protein [Jeotgalibacillus terrae]
MEEAIEEFKTPMKELPLDHRRVVDFLREGKENTTTSKYIAQLTGFTTVRVRSIIRDLIVKYGYVIGASNEVDSQGYYIPVTAEEELRCIHNLRSRRVEITKREKALITNISARYGDDGVTAIEDSDL